MRRRNVLFSKVEGGILGDMGSVLSGSVVVGLAFAFAGPFLTVLIVVASIVYGTSLMFYFLTPKALRTKLKDWG